MLISSGSRIDLVSILLCSTLYSRPGWEKPREQVLGLSKEFGSDGDIDDFECRQRT